MKKYQTKSNSETTKLGQEFAKKMVVGDSVCLYGELGSGKTTFSKGVARGLGIKSRLISPTFVLVRKHEVDRKYYVSPARQSPDGSSRMAGGGIKYLYHIDLYRLENNSDAKGIGLDEILEQKDAVTLIEWPEKAEKILPNKRWTIRFLYKGKNIRNITISKNE